MLSLARAGRGGLVLDTGPPGLGKTALLRELAATSEKAASWWATAGELEDQAPFGVVRQLLDRTLRECPEAERIRLSPGPAQPAVDHILGRQTRQVDQAAMFHGLTWLVECLAEDEPRLVIVDDAQGADEDSLLFLPHLAPRLRDLRIMVALGIRDQLAEGRRAILAGLLAPPTARVLRLGPLCTRSVGALLRTSDPVLAETAAEFTGGNPFLAVALADLLAVSPAT